MPKNFSAFKRYEIIDRLLRTGQYPTVDDFVDEIYDEIGQSVSTRTISDDIKKMREEPSMQAPIAFHRDKRGYYYTDPHYILKRMPLDQDDLAGLYYVANVVLSQMRHVPIIGQSLHTIDKIMDAVRIGRYIDGDATSYLQFESVPYVQGAENLTRLVEARENRKVVSFLYQKFGEDEQRKHVVSPLLLKEYRNRWYLVGRINGKQYATTFGLDRIYDLQVLEGGNYAFLPGFDPEAFFRHSLGVFVKQEEPVRIILTFQPEQSDYVLSQPLHPTQEVLVNDDHECRIAITVYHTIEVEMLILSYGSKVQVLEPATVRQAIQQQVAAMVSAYQS
jgi:predicted DNA-binding transcriptional regulator YafY